MKRTIILRLIESHRLMYPIINRELLLLDWNEIRDDLQMLSPKPFSEVSPDALSFRTRFISTGHRRLACNVAIRIHSKHLWVPVIADTGSPEIYLSKQTFEEFGIENPRLYNNISIGKWTGEAVLSLGRSVDSVNILGMNFLSIGLGKLFEEHFDSISGSVRKEPPSDVRMFLINLFPEKTVQELVLKTFGNYSGEELYRRIDSRDALDILEAGKNNFLNAAIHDGNDKLWNLVNDINIPDVYIRIKNVILE